MRVIVSKTFLVRLCRGLTSTFLEQGVVVFAFFGRFWFRAVIQQRKEASFFLCCASAPRRRYLFPALGGMGQQHTLLGVLISPGH